MASIQQRGKGSFLIQFYDRDGRKRGVSISGTTKKFAQSLAVRIEALNAAQRSGHSLDGATAQWLNEIGDTLAGKLAKVGLIEPRSVKTLGEFLDEYFKSRTDWAPRTRRKHNTTKDYLLRFFGDDKPLRDVTQADADDFHRHLKHTVKSGRKSTDTDVDDDNPLRDSTVWKHISNARVYFTAAMRKRMIDENPFTHVSVRKTSGERFHFVTPAETEAVFNACPNIQWRAIFALARYGGLRIPSEIQGLELSHILWDQNKVLVHSPKTERYSGRDKRFIPLFPELRPYLEAVYDEAKEGQRYVITATRKPDGELSSAYLRKRMLKIIENAGIVPWPKVFQNCRSTRQTELENKYASHKVCAWMGNTERIARKHYLQVTEDDFQQAATPWPGPGTEPEKMTAEKVMLQMMTQIAENAGEGGIDAKLMLSNILQNPAFSRVFSPSLTPQIAAEGLEPPTRGL